MPDIRDLLAGAADGPSGGFDPDAIRDRVQQRTRRRRAAGAVAAVALVGGLAVGVAALGNDTSPDEQIYAGDPSSTTTDGATTTTPTTPTTPTTTSTTIDDGEAPASELEDGRHFGYVVGYEQDDSGTATVVVFDLAELYTGDEADAEAAEDGVIAEGEEIENDVYIRNVNERLRRVLVADGASISVVRCDAGCESVPGDLATLRERPTPTPVWLTVERGAITDVEEQYLP